VRPFYGPGRFWARVRCPSFRQLLYRLKGCNPAFKGEKFVCGFWNSHLRRCGVCYLAMSIVDGYFSARWLWRRCFLAAQSLGGASPGLATQRWTNQYPNANFVGDYRVLGSNWTVDIRKVARTKDGLLDGGASLALFTGSIRRWTFWASVPQSQVITWRYAFLTGSTIYCRPYLSLFFQK
jgi:hypothetical protein